MNLEQGKKQLVRSLQQLRQLNQGLQLVLQPNLSPA